MISEDLHQSFILLLFSDSNDYVLSVSLVLKNHRRQRTILETIFLWKISLINKGFSLLIRDHSDSKSVS